MFLILIKLISTSFAEDDISVVDLINKQLKKVFEKGKLEGEFVIPFNSDGTASKSYTFSGKVIKADIPVKAMK